MLFDSTVENEDHIQALICETGKAVGKYPIKKMKSREALKSDIFVQSK